MPADNVVPLRRAQQPPGDVLEEARALIAEWEALSARERNYRSSMFSDLFYDALKRLAGSCAPLREEAARQLEDIFTQAERRAMYGDDQAQAMTQPRRRLHVVKGSPGGRALSPGARTPPGVNSRK